MTHFRHKARIRALQALYESDSSGHDPLATLKWLSQELTLPAPVVSYAEDLIKGVVENKSQIDSLIGTYAPNWPVEQLATVDRNILRLAIFEILVDNKVPLKAAINEAVELAKIFGSYNSYRFINGVLGSISEVQINSR